MLLAKTLQSSTFKLALIAIVVFGAVVITLFAYVRLSTISYVRGRIDRTIQADLLSLENAYATEGREKAAARITERIADPHSDNAVYLLTDASLRPIAGNLERWPALTDEANEKVEFTLPDYDLRVRAAFASLLGGEHLLVGRTINELDPFLNRIDAALVLTFVLVFVLAGMASVLITKRTVGRIEAINATSRAIMQSGLGRHIPLGGSHDEWDELAANLNSMLDRIQSLIAEVKQATDNVAHDLRTPLAKIRARLEKAYYGQRDPEQDRALLGAAIANLDGVIRMFSSLIRISQIEAYDTSASFGAVNLGQIASDVVELFDAAAENRRIKLHLIGDSHVTAVGARDLLFDALANIVDNAIKYGKEGGQVRVEATQAIGGGVLSVADDGPGIPANERQNVFKRFYRLERSRASAGNGLGLSLVAAIARLHGARIELSDNLPGLKFQLWFPSPEKFSSRA